MGWLSKAWKGVKKVVKKAAKDVKGLAKKIAYAVPGGKALWKAGSRLGKGIMKVVGKVTSALGPVGMIALSILAPYAAPLWHAFGAASAAAGGVLGSIGTAVYTAGNWVGATIGSMTQGISKAIGTIAEGGLSGIAEGSLSKAASEAVNGFANAFTGKAGAAGVQAGVNAAIDSSIAQAAGQSVYDQTINMIKNDIAGAGATATDFNQTGGMSVGNEVVDPITGVVSNRPLMSPVADPLTQSIADSTSPLVSDAARATAKREITSTLAPKTNYVAPTGGSSLLNKAAEVGKSMVDGTYQDQIISPSPISSVGGETFSSFGRAQGGVGSGGGEFLSQSMLQAIQQQQQRMSRGFGY